MQCTPGASHYARTHATDTTDEQRVAATTTTEQPAYRVAVLKQHGNHVRLPRNETKRLDRERRPGCINMKLRTPTHARERPRHQVNAWGYCSRTWRSSEGMGTPRFAHSTVNSRKWWDATSHNLLGHNNNTAPCSFSPQPQHGMRGGGLSYRNTLEEYHMPTTPTWFGSHSQATTWPFGSWAPRAAPVSSVSHKRMPVSRPSGSGSYERGPAMLTPRGMHNQWPLLSTYDMLRNPERACTSSWLAWRCGGQ